MLELLHSRRIRLLWTALVHIGASPGPVSVKRLAERLDCSRRYLESDLQSLTHRGLLESRRGAQGGYLLARSPHRISLWDVIEALQERETGACDSDCPVQRQVVLPQLKQAGDAIRSALEGIQLSDALEMASRSSLVSPSARTADFSI